MVNRPTALFRYRSGARLILDRKSSPAQGVIQNRAATRETKQTQIYVNESDYMMYFTLHFIRSRTVLGQRAHQTFHRLVRHQTHPYQARVLQPGSEEMDPLAGAIAKLHFHLPKIVLTELSGKTFEANQRLRRFRTKRGHQRIEHRLSSSIAGFPNSPQNLQRC